MNFEENEIEVTESFFPSAALMDKVNIKYYYFFIY
jgi:hypothetical protein